MEKQKKTVSKLKLNKLSVNELEKRAMKCIKGGCGCKSSCEETSPSISTLDQYGY